MKNNAAVDLALDGTSVEVAVNINIDLNKEEIAEVVQVFLRLLEDKIGGWFAKAAIRTVHGLITKWRKSWQT